jgi:hypothetical protein
MMDGSPGNPLFNIGHLADDGAEGRQSWDVLSPAGSGARDQGWCSEPPPQPLVEAVTLYWLNRGYLLAILSAVFAVFACAISAPAATDPSGMPRVRDNGDPAIAALIREATARSATFRRLVETIDATDGIVYVEQGRCRRGVRAYLALTVVVAGPHRVLRIVVDGRRDPDTLMAAIGHELRHAVEVLSDPAITSNPAIYFFYQREGPTGRDRFETPAARRAGSEVLSELSRAGDASR